MAIDIVKGMPAQAVRPHISHTQVSMYDECTLRWWFRYVCKIRKQQTIQMLTGDVVHRMLAENFKQKAMTCMDLPLEEMLDNFVQLFDLKVMEGVDIPVNKTAASFREAGLNVLSFYMKHVAPPLVPRMVKLAGTDEPIPAVEIELRRRIPETDHDMLGYLDLWLYEGPIVDYKVVSKKWGKKDLMTKGKQALAYYLLLGRVEPFEFHVLPRDNPQLQTVKINHYTEYDLQSYTHHLWDVINGMEMLKRGEIEPAPKDGFCSEHLCQHYQQCKEWKYGIFDPEKYKTPDMPSGELEEELE